MTPVDRSQREMVRHYHQHRAKLLETDAERLALPGTQLQTKPPIDKGKCKGAVKGFLQNAERAAGGLPLRRALPARLRNMVPAPIRRTVASTGLTSPKGETRNDPAPKQSV